MRILSIFRRRRHGLHVADALAETAPACRACSREDYGPCTCPEDCGWLSCTGERRFVPPVVPHGIATPETLAELVAQAQTETGVRVPAYALEAAEAEPVAPAVAPPSVVAALPPPSMPYASDVSRIMVHQIAYPDVADLTPDKDRHYRDMLRRVGVATGTHTSLEDTSTWALPALEPGNGTGVKL